MTWDPNSLELDEDTDWSFADTLPESRWSWAFQNIACSAQSGTPVFSGTADDELHWTPGHNGKGLIESDNTVHTWNCVGPNQEPWHYEYVAEHKLEHVMVYFYIDPDGGVYQFTSGVEGEEDERLRQLLRDTDPNLTVGQSGWTFSKTADVDNDILDWDEGNFGKGIVDVHGNVYTWNEDDGWDIHRDYEEDHDITGRYYFTINPDGQIEAADMVPLSADVIDLITEADPNLHGDPTVAWTF